MTKPRNILVNLGGIKVAIAPHELFCYLAKVYADPGSTLPTEVFGTPEHEEAWTFVRGAIRGKELAYGTVEMWDVGYPQNPKKVKDLGRIDRPSQDPVLS
ncbi:hypothetical protein [Nonomuraea sp. SYSU D8015]|uniref:hypothetical protein n=1 Tax=Nonomuraea sp. SYSU D8015 TaxID=2593644 RepID=UPI0016616DB3|nr:hypothetical protein [Nonomuraea sp. SYSU D8015]